MPDVKLIKLSDSLRRSRNIIENKRNIIEELVKETRNVLCDEVEKNMAQEINKAPSRKSKLRSRIPRSPTVK